MATLVERFQAKDNEQYKKKLKNSTIIKSKTVSTKKLHLISEEKRKRSLILLFLTLAYSLIVKIVLGELFKFDLLVIVNLVMIATDLYLRLNDNSVWALNHHQKVQTITMINKLSVLIIFFCTIGLHIEELLAIVEAINATNEGFEALSFFEQLKIIFKQEPWFIITFAWSIISIIPVLLFFIRFMLKYYVHNLFNLIPVLYPIALIRWIMAFRKFKEYVLIDSETCQINYRKLNFCAEVFFKIFLRIAFIVLLVVLLLWFTNYINGI